MVSKHMAMRNIKKGKICHHVDALLQPRLETLSSVILTEFADAFREGRDFHDKEAGLRVVSKPFPHCVVERLMDDTFLHAVRNEVIKEATIARSNDLYEFHQTSDFKQTSNPVLQELRATMYGSVMLRLMQSLTHLSLSPVVDMSGHWYKDACHLLCHDDELEGRRLAYILYLVDDDWTDADGGQLCFFDMDASRHPINVSAVVTPKWNTLAFFEVTPTSYHAVSEVLSTTKKRISISGWFHGVDKVSFPESVLPMPLTVLPKEITMTSNVFLMDKLVNDCYLQKSFIAAGGYRFMRKSCLLLPDFLRAEVYSCLLEECENHRKTTLKGPANVARFVELDMTDSHSPSSILHQVAAMMHSEEFFTWLRAVTGVHVPHAGDVVACRFRHGDYSLLHDFLRSAPGLDVDLCVCHRWEVSWNGQTVYCLDGDQIDRDDAQRATSSHQDLVATRAEKDASTVILSVEPLPNSLSLVLRDQGCMRFTKYINHHAQCTMHRIGTVYHVEFSEGEDEDSDEEDEFDDEDSSMDEESYSMMNNNKHNEDKEESANEENVDRGEKNR